MRPRAILLIALLLTLLLLTLLPNLARAVEIRSVPVVTQLQGVTFYRTSITLSNGNPTATTPVEMLFSYRSPADGTFQTATLALSPALGPNQVRFFEDIVQAFKDAGLAAGDTAIVLGRSTSGAKRES